MGDILEFKHNGKVYRRRNYYTALPGNRAYTPEERKKAFIRKMKDEISKNNRAEAQRKRHERIRILKEIEEIKHLGIPFNKESLEQNGIPIDEEKIKYYGIEFDE